MDSDNGTDGDTRTRAPIDRNVYDDLVDYAEQRYGTAYGFRQDVMTDAAELLIAVWEAGWTSQDIRSFLDEQAVNVPQRRVIERELEETDNTAEMINEMYDDLQELKGQIEQVNENIE